MSEWKADVPFPAENMNKCRGCDAPIGWIRWIDDDNRERPHPVEVKGWAGERCADNALGSKRGFTLDGDRCSVRAAEPSMFSARQTVVFQSHFSFCPKADRFRPKPQAKA